MDERRYFLALSLAPGIGEKRLDRLLKHFGSAKKAWKGKKEEYLVSGISYLVYEKLNKFRDTFDIEAYIKKLNNRQVGFVTLADKEYPFNLKQIQFPPPVLFYKGSLKNIEWDKALAVVGTRKMTQYGREVTEKIVTEIVMSGIPVISGLALGVDAMAHKVTIDNNGKTVAVLGSGVDVCFPRENHLLYNKIIETGGVVVSEYPLGTVPAKGTFPARNRIISGLSKGVLVTEAGEDSGSLITANYAREQGRYVFAVPGPITSKQSEGTTKLLKNGAVLVQSSKDILEVLGVKDEKKSLNIEKLNLSQEEKKLVEALENEKMDINSLFKKTKIQVSKLNILLTELELKGIVRNYSGEFGLSNL